MGGVAALGAEFSENPSKLNQWVAFRRRAAVQPVDLELGDTIRVITRFVEPVLEAIAAVGEFDRAWPIGGPWGPSSK